MNLFTRNAASVAAFTVLGITAGGIAWAESSTAPTTSTAASGSTATANATDATSPAPTAGNKAALRLRGLGKRVLHGEVVLQTRKGIITADIARGTVSAIDGNSISVHSADGVTTTFTVDAKTKARSAGKVIPIGDVHPGDKVAVLGVKTGGAAPTARLVRKLPAVDTTSNG